MVVVLLRMLRREGVWWFGLWTLISGIPTFLGGLPELKSGNFFTGYELGAMALILLLAP